MGHRITLDIRALSVQLEHLVAGTDIEAAQLAESYTTAMYDAGEKVVDGQHDVPVTPSEMAELIDEVLEDGDRHDWGVAYIARLTDGRICAFGEQSTCEDGCCSRGIWHVANTRDELPEVLFDR